jgi:hypothetical protein
MGFHLLMFGMAMLAIGIILYGVSTISAGVLEAYLLAYGGRP